MTPDCMNPMESWLAGRQLIKLVSFDTKRIESFATYIKINADFRVEMKKVQVQMSNTCHAVLKDYANAWGMTMSEVMYEAIRSYIHKNTEHFEHINSLLAFRGIPIDKRISKDCYGHLCFACQHKTACRTGLYEGGLEMNDEAKKYTALHTPQSTSGFQPQPKE